MRTISATIGHRAKFFSSLPAPVWTLVVINAASAIALAGFGLAPPSSAAPVALDGVCAALLATAAVATIAFGHRVGERLLLTQAGGRIAVSAALAGTAVTAGGTFLAYAGFLWVAVWVAVFYSRRELLLTLGAELLSVVVAVLLNADALRTLTDGLAMLGASAVMSGVLFHVIGGLKRQARADHLTGLLNRHGIVQTLGESRWRAGQPTSLVAIDLDGLKTINDRGGHLAGDRTIVALAAELSRAAGRADLTARIGGDEFLVILPGRSAAEATRWAYRLRASTEFSWSFGVAERCSGEPLETWLARADQRMYEAKAHADGRNRLGDSGWVGTPRVCRLVAERPATA